MKKLFLICFSVLSFSLISAQDDIDTYYYEPSIIVAANSVDSKGVMVGEGTEFYLEDGLVEIVIMLQQETPLLLTELVYDIYSGEELDVFDNSERIEINDLQWNYVQFSIEIRGEGNYVIDLYNQDDIYINSLEFTVK